VSRFYWRLFLAFVLVIVLTTVVSASVGSLLLGSALDSSRQESLRATLSAVAAQAEGVLASGGETALEEWLRDQQAELSIPLLVITPQQRELLDRPLPPGSERMLRRLQRFAAPERGPAGRRGPPVRGLRGPDGELYLLLVSPRPGFAGGRFQQPMLRAVFLFVLLVVGALACLALARYLVRPVRALRSAGQAIGAGDLGARAGPDMRARKDEFGALARDFDQMAERVQSLVDGQQRMLRDVSHELRSPLARLQIAAGLLRQQSDGATLPQVDRIEREVSKLDALIGQILAFARVSSLQRIEREEVELGDLLAALVADARFEGQAAGVDVVLDAGDSVSVLADEQLLSSALENVIRNAIQHAGSRVEVGYTRTPGAEVAIQVGDDGPGLDPVQRARMFEPFHAGPDGGAGVGLAIAARAVKLHDGSIEVAEQDSGGLLMSIRLPTS
jgi:two-component system sensor histidine kinase CpxA